MLITDETKSHQKSVHFIDEQIDPKFHMKWQGAQNLRESIS